MNMTTITFTDQELAMVRQAVEVFNDMTNDCLFDNMSADLFPTTEEPVVLTHAKAGKLRDELYEVMDTYASLRSLTTKLGIKLNKQGYAA